VSNEKNTASAGTLEQLGERTSDFWWNLVYFLILAIAISFVLLNNDLDNIISATGIMILAVLVILELYPTIYLVKLAIRFKNNR
jgi:hypothetical protein